MGSSSFSDASDDAELSKSLSSRPKRAILRAGPWVYQSSQWQLDSGNSQISWIIIFVSGQAATASFEGQQSMADAPKNDHIQPALSGTATPMDSPQVAVRSLLHETPLDRPPTAPTSPTIPNRHRRKRSSSQKRSPTTPAGPALDGQSQAEKQTLQQTVSDLQSLLLQYLRLLPWFPPDHPIVCVQDPLSAEAHQDPCLAYRGSSSIGSLHLRHV